MDKFNCVYFVKILGGSDNSLNKLGMVGIDYFVLFMIFYKITKITKLTMQSRVLNVYADKIKLYKSTLFLIKIVISKHHITNVFL